MHSCECSFMYQLKPVNFSPIWYGGDDARLQSPGSIAGPGEFFDNSFSFFIPDFHHWQGLFEEL